MVRVRVLLGEEQGSLNFSPPYYLVDQGGRPPLDRHALEHQVYVLNGRALVRAGSKAIEVKPGYALFIPCNEVHRLINVADEPLQFLCIKGLPKLYDAKKIDPWGRLESGSCSEFDYASSVDGAKSSSRGSFRLVKPC